MEPVSAMRWLYWAPRVLALLFVVFVGAFALDVFGEGYSVGETLEALLIHLIPAALVLGVLVIAWRWEKAGGAFFVALGAGYVVSTWGRVHWSVDLLIGGPPVLIGLLFLMEGCSPALHAGGKD